MQQMKNNLAKVEQASLSWSQDEPDQDRTKEDDSSEEYILI
jgi:hypothetical protein